MTVPSRTEQGILRGGELPTPGVCKQSIQKTQLGLEGHMGIYQVWQEKTLEVPNEAQHQTIPTSGCSKEPLPAHFTSSFCLF